ncbi:MAG: hypothetical protein IPL36_07260 [Nigerium sp.]|nr:hypothetical protein [Nigerium sp.]
MYDVISPANEHELIGVLQAGSLKARVLRLTVRMTPDELSIRRGNAPGEEGLDFCIDTLHLDRPIAIVGEITAAGARRAARIDALGEFEDIRQNTLQLVVVSNG